MNRRDGFKTIHATDFYCHEHGFTDGPCACLQRAPAPPFVEPEDEVVALRAENQRLRDAMVYCASVLESHQAPVLYGGKHMMDGEDAKWVARKLRAALTGDTP